LHVEALDGFFGKKSVPAESVKLLDTSVLIDGRIADICDAQFLEGVLGVPQFVLRELTDGRRFPRPVEAAARKARLEVLQRIQKMRKSRWDSGG